MKDFDETPLGHELTDDQRRCIADICGFDMTLWGEIQFVEFRVCAYEHIVWRVGVGDQEVLAESTPPNVPRTVILGDTKYVWWPAKLNDAAREVLSRELRLPVICT